MWGTGPNDMGPHCPTTKSLRPLGPATSLRADGIWRRPKEAAEGTVDYRKAEADATRSFMPDQRQNVYTSNPGSSRILGDKGAAF